MQLQLRPAPPSAARPAGVLLPGASPSGWIAALSGAGLSPEAVIAYAVPGDAAGSVWGCLLLTGQAALRGLPPSATFIHYRGDLLLIPDGAVLYPALSAEELARHLRAGLHLLHPQTGLVPLEEPLDWAALIALPDELPLAARRPPEPVFRPDTLRSFAVHAPAPEEGLADLEQRLAPGEKGPPDKPLTTFEKTKLRLYRALFSKGADGQPAEKGALLRRLEKLFPGKDGSPPALDKMQQDYEELERRNNSEIEKLIQMLKRDPAEALKYAVPIGEGTGRGEPGELQIGKVWNSFSLFGGSGGTRGGGAGATIGLSQQQQLYQEYLRMAAAFIEKGDIEKAAFVYLKLLKDYGMAAQTLQNGGLYADAAAVYLRFLNNKEAAADCYAKASMYGQAIPLYEELGHHETAGDLYMKINRRDEAMAAYRKVVDKLTGNNQLLKAASLCREKMGDLPAAQALLLQGWRSGTDAFNCLHTYLESIDEDRVRRSAVSTIYQTDLDAGNARHFLNALRYEVPKDAESSALAREIALEIIADYVAQQPGLINDLSHFTPDNTLIAKDVLRFKTGRVKPSGKG